MKKLQTTMLCIAVATAFSCSSQYGPTENEDYAGAWVGDSELGITEVIEMTDTTCETFVRYEGLNGYVPAWKGFISKESDSQIMIVTTEIYQLDDFARDPDTGRITAGASDGEYVAADEVDTSFSAWNYRTIFEYTVSGDSIVFDGVFPLTRTDSVSDDLLN